MAKYTPLQTYLAGLPAGTYEVTLTFARIERLLNARLPASVRIYRPWWGNEKEGRHVQAAGWLDAGWEVDSVDLQAQWVCFRRQ